MAARRELYGRSDMDLTSEEAMDEIAADYAGRMMEDGAFLDKFIQSHSADRTLLEKIRDAIRTLISKLTGAERRAAQTAEGKLTAALEAAAGQAGKLEANKNAAPEGGEQRFSIKRTSQMTLAAQLKMFYDGKMASSDAFYFGETPDTLAAAGLDPLPLAFTVADFRKSAKEKHNVPRRVWKNLHESPENALFAFRLGDRVGIMTGDIDGDGKPLLVGIERNAVMDRKPVNAIRSVYGLDNPGPWLQNQFKSGKEYIPLNKQRADAFLQTYGAYSASVGDGIRSLDGTVTQNEPESKGKFSLKTPVEETRNLIALHNLTQEEILAITDSLNERLHDLTARIAEKSPRAAVNDLMQMDIIGNILMEVAEGGTYTIDSIERVFNGQYGYRIGNELAADIRDLLFDVTQMPVNMFEAKPERAVGFDEVLAAVLPSDASAELREALAGRGVNVLTYESGNDADRIAKVNSVEGATFSLKGSEELTREINRIMREGNKAGRSEADMMVDIRAAVDQVYQDMVKEYGAIKPGERAARKVQVPKRTADDKKVSHTVRTILEAGATPDAAIPNIEQLTAQGDFSYEVITDKAAMTDADAKIRDKGYQTALLEWSGDVREGKVSKANTAMGWALYNAAANEGDLKTAMSILTQMVEHQRNAAQAVQATRILKKMSPDAQLYGVQRSVENLREELKEKYGKKAPNIQINEELARRFLEAQDDKARDRAMQDLYRDIGKQMPSRFVDKWNAWRYLAMLGNPRTHVRNVVGNAFFAPVVATKNLTATAIEAVVDAVAPGKISRTKGTLDRKLLSAAWSDYVNAEDQIEGGGKYNENRAMNQYIQDGRVIFKTKALETVRKKNTAALTTEDMWFSRPHYAVALAQYCKANGISEAQIRGGKGLDRARAYAVREAQKATYRDVNAFSQTISELGRYSGNNPVKKGVSTVLEGILPFRKTPANILVRGLEYSPAGLLKSLTYDLAQVKKGKKLAAEAIDGISAGLTGTGLMALGVFLAAEGLVRGSGGDDEDKANFEELQGHQAYALELDNGTSVTLDWLAPEVLPFFVGVNLYEQSLSTTEGLTMSDILTATANVTEPMLEMSCLQSLNDVFDSVAYASQDGLSALPSVLASAATSYLTQAFPTLLGQVERTTENTRMTTYTEKNAFLTTDMQYTIGRISARMPIGDYRQVPYIDAWGRTESTGNAGERAFNNFANPAYMSTVETSPMEEELLRLYEATGEGSVLPARAAKSFKVGGEQKQLTAQEYVKYATAKGQGAYKILTALTQSKAYRSMSDSEKAEAVDLSYAYANAAAKAAVSSYKADGWIGKALATTKATGIKEDQYVALYLAQKGVESLKDADGETIANSKSLLIMEMIFNTPGLTEKQRVALFQDFGVGKTVIGWNKALVREKLEKMRKK